jgi:hypothetical protein
LFDGIVLSAQGRGYPDIPTRRHVFFHIFFVFFVLYVITELRFEMYIFLTAADFCATLLNSCACLCIA